MIYWGSGWVPDGRMERAENEKNCPAADGFLHDSANELGLACCSDPMLLVNSSSAHPWITQEDSHILAPNCPCQEHSLPSSLCQTHLYKNNNSHLDSHK